MVIRNDMTNSDIIEEILFMSHSLHIQEEVMGYAQTLLINNPKIGKATAYQQAFDEISNQ
tara:strand:+ start:1037 stop:1216 length:180 start_codon:yes stop_codon:yes gene_type:complete